MAANVLGIPFVTLPPNAGPTPAAAARNGIAAEVATLILAGFLIGLDALTQAGIVGHTSSLLDLFAGVALGATFGVVPNLGAKAQVTANTAAVVAAHQRLDAAGAPPASDLAPPAGPTHDR